MIKTEGMESSDMTDLRNLEVSVGDTNHQAVTQRPFLKVKSFAEESASNTVSNFVEESTSNTVSTAWLKDQIKVKDMTILSLSTTIQATQGMYKNAIDSLTKQVIDLQRPIYASTIEEATKHKDPLEEESRSKDKYADKITNLEHPNSDKDQEIETLTSSVNALKSKIREQAYIIQTKDRKLEDKQYNFRIQESNMKAKYKEDIADLEQKLSSKEEKIESLKTCIRSFEDENKKLKRLKRFTIQMKGGKPEDMSNYCTSQESNMKHEQAKNVADLEKQRTEKDEQELHMNAKNAEAISELENRVSDKVNEIEALKLSIRSLEDEIKKQNYTIQTKDRTLEDTQHRFQMEESNMKAKHAKELAELEKHISEMNVKETALIAEYAKNIAEMENQLSGKIEQIDTLKFKITTLEAEGEDQNDAIQTKARALEDMQLNFQVQESNNLEYAEKIVKLEENMLKKDKQIETLKISVNSLESELKKKDYVIRTKDRKLEGQINEIANLKGSKSKDELSSNKAPAILKSPTFSTQSSCLQAENKVREDTNANESSSRECYTEAKLQKHMKSRTDLQKQIDDLQTAKITLEFIIEQESKLKEGYVEKNTKSEKQAKERDDEIKNLKLNINSLEAEIEKKYHIIQTKDGELKQLTDLQPQISVLQRENGALKDKIKELELKECYTEKMLNWEQQVKEKDDKIEILNHNIFSLEAELEKKQNLVQTKNRELKYLADLQEKIDGSETENRTLKNELEQELKLNQSCIEKNAKLEFTVYMSKAHVKEKEEKIEILTANIQSLEAENLKKYQVFTEKEFQKNTELKNQIKEIRSLKAELSAANASNEQERQSLESIANDLRKENCAISSKLNIKDMEISLCTNEVEKAKALIENVLKNNSNELFGESCITSPNDPKDSESLHCNTKVLENANDPVLIPFFTPAVPSKIRSLKNANDNKTPPRNTAINAHGRVSQQATSSSVSSASAGLDGILPVPPPLMPNSSFSSTSKDPTPNCSTSVSKQIPQLATTYHSGFVSLQPSMQLPQFVPRSIQMASLRSKPYSSFPQSSYGYVIRGQSRGRRAKRSRR